MLERHSRALASEGCREKLRCQNALLRISILSGGCIAVEGSHGNEGLLLGKPPEEPDQPITENSLLEVLDGVIMMYNLSVHQQLGKVSRNPVPQHPCFYTVSCLFGDCVCPFFLTFHGGSGCVLTCLGQNALICSSNLLFFRWLVCQMM